MIKVYPYETLGHKDHGWLNARHHFSFGGYNNPKRMHFGSLRVINDDIIAANTGFPPHPHNDMEIITYVRSGAITHKDSLGNTGRTVAGDVQVMSAGTGVMHSEYNLENEETKLYQIWILPNEISVEPRWDTAQFPKKKANDNLTLLVSGRKEHQDIGALYIHQDTAIFGGNIKAGSDIIQDIKHQAYILVSKGEISIDSERLKQGDGAEITDINTIYINAISDAEILVIDVPA